MPEEAVGEGCRGTGPPACPRGRTRRGSRCLRVPPAGYQGAGVGGRAGGSRRSCGRREIAGRDRDVGRVEAGWTGGRPGAAPGAPGSAGFGRPGARPGAPALARREPGGWGAHPRWPAAPGSPAAGRPRSRSPSGRPGRASRQRGQCRSAVPGTAAGPPGPGLRPRSGQGRGVLPQHRWGTGTFNPKLISRSASQNVSTPPSRLLRPEAATGKSGRSLPGSGLPPALRGGGSGPGAAGGSAVPGFGETLVGPLLPSPGGSTQVSSPRRGTRQPGGLWVPCACLG